MEAQCWICPMCFDDHSQNIQCKPDDLKDVINGLRAERDRLKASLKLNCGFSDEFIGKIASGADIHGEGEGHG